MPGCIFGIHGVGVGINYGQIADNLPPPVHVSSLLRSLNISRVKLYDADPRVLTAFANTDVEFVIGLGNEYLQRMSDPAQAQAWVRQNVQPYGSQINCIFVGNELLSTNNSELIPFLVPAMQNVYDALSSLGLSKQVNVTTAHSYDILATSYPPSAGSFKPNLAEYIQRILQFHSQTGSPFLINAYPFFAYKGSPNEVSLNYVLFQPNEGMTDPATNFHYDNMLDAQLDAVYSAIKAMGHTNIQVKVSETGWPSRGDSDETGATPENARLYNGNLLKRIQQKKGTPANPSIPLDIYVFALFNENQKFGPTSERNYGLYYPNGTAVYNIGLQGGGGGGGGGDDGDGGQGFIPGISADPHMEYSASRKNVRDV